MNDPQQVFDEFVKEQNAKYHQKLAAKQAADQAEAKAKAEEQNS